MDPYSSGEEIVIKTRKPYTITKQRERWTEEEHNRFLEALKLYGRAWQRIEEHIGTKTAVQIRSHAQKFFTKLEKEALVKGVPIGQALDIEIPPPRPKRKPCNPYPRKISNGRTTCQVGSKDEKSGIPVYSVSQAKHVLDLEKEPTPERNSDERIACAKENQDENRNSGFVLLSTSPHTCPSSANKSSMPTLAVPRKSCTFKEFVPVINEVVNKDETNESYVTVEPRENQYSAKSDTRQSFPENGICDSMTLAKTHPVNENLVVGKGQNLDQSKKETELKNDVQNMEGQPRHVPVHILDGSLGMNAANVSFHMSSQQSMFHQMGGVHPNLFMNLSSSSTSEHQNSTPRFTINQPFPGIHPIVTPIQNQDDYQSLLHASSAFSSLIVSTLLQNPAAHAAASFAASFWPCSSMEDPAGSATGTTGGFPVRQINTTPSIAAIAAATVAAATAWWAAHGVLPVCAPFHMSFNYAPASAASTVPVGASQARADNSERKEKTDAPALETAQMEAELSSEALQEQHSTSKSPALSMSDSDEINGLKLHNGSTAIETEKAVAAAQLHDNKAKGRKQVDRSSCGSNTPSSSEVETDALEKHEKGNEELREAAIDHPTGDSISRRGRSSSGSNDSWKEVSEEGRLAFQALFSREVLPQSFSPPYDSMNNLEKDKQTVDEKDTEGSPSRVDVSGKIGGVSCCSQPAEENVYLKGETNKLTAEGLLTMGKFKVRHTGFKPYKRCSVEAQQQECSRVVNTSSCQDQEKGPKRIRLEAEASNLIP
ncbi:hypothetical protein M9H77_33076 [Catharanthus roseus]|uniref:Uncharacterized protein n=1 Tax=Catharanthus roseus TaxID=4058 RepID=A0ACB9ZIN0_CATRO|nr:hypothetical protein M9H77_33076 [Catharanthus roseus]